MNQTDGISHLSYWFSNLEIGNAVPIGILWPGDCVLPVFVDYIAEGREAIQSGQLLATFLNANDAFPGAFVMETRKSGGWIFAEALAAVTDSGDAVTNSPSEFLTAAYFTEPSRL